jgi:hypothetical protein
MGEILKTLKELKLDDNTIVIFISDNGRWIEEQIGDHAGHADPLRGAKMTAWEGGPRVPCIMRWPGNIPAGKTSDAIVTTMDLLPTFASLAGVPLPHDRTIDGKNILPLITGKTAQSPHESYFYYCYTHLHGVRDDRLVRRLKGTPCVRVMGVIERDESWDHVTYDNRKLGQIAAEYVLARGHRHAAFISSTDKGFLAERGKVFSDTLAAVGADSLDFIDEAMQDETGSVIRIIPDRVDGLLEGILTSDPRPTALFLATDALAPAVCGELQRRCLAIGNDIDVISCNNEQMLLNHLQPRPATIDIHAELVGKKAVEQLLWRIDHPCQPRVTMALEPMLVEGRGDFSANIFDPTEERAVQERKMESQTEVTP